eukprot:jgi/Mesen1/878/ME000115S00008
MAEADELKALHAKVLAKQEESTRQGDTVRALKAAKADASAVEEAILKLKNLKIELEGLTKEYTAKTAGSKDSSVNREAFRQAVNNALERRLFYIPSFKIYGGVAGLYDYGPPGCAVKQNVLAFWRQVGACAEAQTHYVLEENMLEVDCPCVTPEAVLRASGHVEKFTDLMVKDEQTGNCFRWDPLASPPSSLPSLSPPLSLCIAPRAGLLRVREFTLAEIEHFVHPDDKAHPKFACVADLEFLLYPRAEQLGPKEPVKARIGDAVAKGVVNNETLGYFIARTFLFLTRLGIDPARLRFRQHLANEMAHYAADCWDAEIQCSYGWIECVGLADRSAFDLKAHTVRAPAPEKSKENLQAYEKFAEPQEVEVGQEGSDLPCTALPLLLHQSCSHLQPYLPL